MKNRSLFERTIESISPRWARKRAADRVALNLIRKYEGASTGRRTDGWVTSGSSANAEIRSSLSMLRARSRQLVRDNPYANRAVGVIVGNMIGYGIMTTPVTRNKAQQKKLAEAWKKWAESTECDAERRHNLNGLQQVAARCIVEAGEVLIRRRWRQSSDGLTVPMQLQVMEPDFIDTLKDGQILDGGNVIVQGIEYDRIGRRVAYYLYDQHPGDVITSVRGSYTSRRVPAEEILHVYRCERAGQVRGVPWAAPIMIRLRDLDDYEDAQLLRQKIAACFAAFVHDAEPEETTGGGTVQIPEHVEPGAIQFLPPGKQVTFGSPPAATGYGEYMSTMLHSVAVGYGVPYESLTGDYSQVNFTSGRMGRIEFNVNLDAWQWNMFIPQFCEGVFAWFRDAAILAGLPAEGATAKHTPPKRHLVDPTREVPALIKAIRGGLQTLAQAQREMGESPEDMLREIAETNKAMDDLGITLDTDPRKVTHQGQNQIEPAANQNE